MLRQLLLVLALVISAAAFIGCERDGANGTTDRDGVQQDQTTTDRTTDQTQDGTATDDFGLQRGTGAQDTATDANAM